MILQERKRRQRRKKRAIVLAVVFSLLALFVVLMLTLFRTNEIRVEGNEIYSDDRIRQTILAQDHSEYTWYLWGKYNWFSGDDPMPFVDEMEVKFNSPSTLTFYVYEKASIGCFYDETSKQYNYFDKEGFVVEQSATLLDDAVEVLGISVENPTLYERMNIEDQDILNYVLTITQCMEKYGLTCEKIRVGNYGRIDLKINHVTVKMGKNTLTEEKVMRLAAIASDLGNRSGVVNLEEWENSEASILFKAIEDASGDANWGRSE